MWVCKGKKHSLFSSFPSRKESVVYGEILELEAKMQIFQVKTYSWESTQYENVRGFGFSIRLFFNSLALSSLFILWL